MLSTRRVLEKDLKQFNNRLFSKALIKTFHEELLHCFINVSAVVGNAMRDLRKEFMVGTGRHDFNTTKNIYIWIGVLAEDDIVPKKLSSEKQ